MAGQPSRASDWNASEALYAFAGWLSSREESLTISATDDAAPIADALKEFIGMWGLPDVREGWHRVQKPGDLH